MQQVEIGSISTNIFTRLKLTDVKLGHSDIPEQNILRFEQLTIRYNLLDIIRNKYTIYSLEINRPQISIVRDSLGHYNFASELIQSKSQARSTNKNSVQIEELKVNHLQLQFVDFRDSLDFDIGEMNINLSPAKEGSLSYSGKIHSGHGKIEWRGVTYNFEPLTSDFNFSDSTIQVNELAIDGDLFRLKASGNYSFLQNKITGGNIRADIDLAQAIQSFPPAIIDFDDNQFSGNLYINGEIAGEVNHPSGKIDVSLNKGELFSTPIENLTAQLNFESQALKLTNFHVKALSGKLSGDGFINITNSIPNYNISLQCQDLALSSILNRLYHHRDEDDLTGSMDGKVQFSGNGVDWKELKANGNFDLSQITIFAKPVPNLTASMIFDKRILDFKLNQNGSHINLSSQIHKNGKINGTGSAYLSSTELIANFFNIQHLTGNLEVSGVFDGDIISPTAALKLHFWDGDYRGFPIQKCTGNIEFQSNQLSFSNLNAFGESNNIETIRQYLPIDSLQGKLRYHLVADGSWQNMKTKLNLSWENCKINQFHFDHLTLNSQSRGFDFLIDSLKIMNNNQLVLLQGQSDFTKNYLTDLNINFIQIDSSSEKQQGKVKITGEYHKKNMTALIQAEKLSFSSLFNFLDLKNKIEGSLNFDCFASGNIFHPDFTAAWEADDFSSNEIRLDSLGGRLKYAHSILTIQALNAVKGNGSLKLNGSTPVNLYNFQFPDNAKSAFNLTARNFDIATFNGLIPNWLKIHGILSCNLRIEEKIASPKIYGQVNVKNGTIRSKNFPVLDSLNFYSEIKRNKLDKFNCIGRIQKSKFTMAGIGEYKDAEYYDFGFILNSNDFGKLTFAGHNRPDINRSLTVNGEQVDLHKISKIFRSRTGLSGRVNFKSIVTGTMDSPQLFFDLKSNQIFVEDTKIDSLKIKAIVKNWIVELRESGFKINQGRINFKGKLPIENPFSDTTSTSDHPVEFVTYARDLNIAWLRPLLPGFTNIQGNVNYLIHVSGTKTQPKFNGFAALNKCSFNLINCISNFNSIQADIEFTDNLIELKNISGMVDEGTFNIKGRTRFQDQQLIDPHLKINLNKIILNYPKTMLLAIEKSEINLEQSADKYKIKGTVTLGETKYFEDFKPKFKEILSEISKHPAAEKNELFKNIFYDVNIQGKENFWIENNAAKIKMSPTLSLVGPAHDPNISGQIVVNKGYILYLDRKFRIEKGLLYFSDPHAINPSIDLSANCIITDYLNGDEKKYTITLNLQGPLKNPELTLASNPQIDKANIIALLTVGRTREQVLTPTDHERSSTFQKILMDRFKEITSQRLAGITEQKLGDAFALENISIEGNLLQVDKSWGPKLTATKQLSDRINMTYSTVVGHATEQQFKLSYRLYKYLSITGTSDQRGQSGLDFIFNLKFY